MSLTLPTIVWISRQKVFTKLTKNIVFKVHLSKKTLKVLGRIKNDFLKIIIVSLTWHRVKWLDPLNSLPFFSGFFLFYHISFLFLWIWIFLFYHISFLYETFSFSALRSIRAMYCFFVFQTIPSEVTSRRVFYPVCQLIQKAFPFFISSTVFQKLLQLYFLPHSHYLKENVELPVD